MCEATTSSGIQIFLCNTYYIRLLLVAAGAYSYLRILEELSNKGEILEISLSFKLIYSVEVSVFLTVKDECRKAVNVQHHSRVVISALINVKSKTMHVVSSNQLN